jgi:hypothetical protein
MAAGVPDTGQGIVFSADHHMQRSCPGPGLKSGGHLTDSGLDGKAVTSQGLTEPSARLLLLPRQLRVSVDAVTQGDKVGFGAVEGRSGSALEVHQLSL